MQYILYNRVVAYQMYSALYISLKHSTRPCVFVSTSPFNLANQMPFTDTLTIRMPLILIPCPQISVINWCPNPSSLLSWTHQYAGHLGLLMSAVCLPILKLQMLLNSCVLLKWNMKSGALRWRPWRYVEQVLFRYIEYVTIVTGRRE